MKKNILITFLGALLIFSIYLNVSYSSRITQLETTIDAKDQLIENQEVKLAEKESEFNMMKGLAEQWSARAYNSGYKDINAIKIGQSD